MQEGSPALERGGMAPPGHIGRDHQTRACLGRRRGDERFGVRRHQ